jgi:hypothetical protein
VISFQSQKNQKAMRAAGNGGPLCFWDHLLDGTAEFHLCYSIGELDCTPELMTGDPPGESVVTGGGALGVAI